MSILTVNVRNISAGIQLKPKLLFHDVFDSIIYLFYILFEIYNQHFLCYQ
jgi:hypothetical protein